MMTRQALLAIALAVGFAAAGCEKKEEQPKDALQQAANAIGEAGNAGVVAILVAADEFDGKSDKTITKCAGCVLGMDGKADNRIEYEEYTLWFCTPGCKDEFNKDVKKSVLALNVPKK